MKKKRIREYIKKDTAIRKKLLDSKITVKTMIYQCEDINKVEKALRNVIDLKPYLKKEDGDEYLIIEAKGYDYIYRIFNHFRKRRVLAALRKYLDKYSTKDTIVIYLHKQAAYAGVLSLSEPGESPLGEIKITIETTDAYEVIRWLTRF